MTPFLHRVAYYSAVVILAASVHTLFGEVKYIDAVCLGMIGVLTVYGQLRFRDRRPRWTAEYVAKVEEETKEIVEMLCPEEKK